MADSEWPTPPFPAGCPGSEDPHPVNGFVFHLLRRQPDQDFKTAYDRGVFQNKPLCLRVAYSCYMSFDVARHFVSFQPQFWRGIARADLASDHGVIKHTPSQNSPEHYSLWLRARFDVRALFREIPASRTQ